jgi:hypothetical protein
MTNDQAAKSSFEKVVTNENFLFSFRAVITLLGAASTILCAVIAMMVSDIKGSIADIRRDVSALERRYNEDRLIMADRLGKVEGQVGQLNGSVEVHRKRLEELDSDKRAVWQRLYEIGRQSPRIGNP